MYNFSIEKIEKMEKLFAAVFIILNCLNFAFGQSRRAPNYSESSADFDKKETSAGNAQNRTEKAAEPKDEGEIIRVDTDLVVIPARISSRDGKIVSGLKREEFRIFENGVEQEIAYFSGEEQPFTVALVLDMSYSSIFKLKDIQDAAFAFTNQLRSPDKVMIVSIDERVNILCEPTNNRKVLKLAIEATKIASGTSFFAGLNVVINEKLKNIAGRKAIVVLSDGVDTTSRGVAPAEILSDISQKDILAFPVQYDTFNDVQKNRRETAQVFFDEDDRPYTIEAPPVAGERKEDYKRASEFLKQFSELSGGRVYRVSSSTNLSDAFANIADELRKTYSLGYYPSGERKNGDKYTLNVRVYRPNLVVRAKNGYFRRKN
jgi:Ca-activated chloride channel family protein